MAPFTHERLAQRVVIGENHAIATLAELVAMTGGPRVLLIATERVASPFVEALRPEAHISRVLRHVPVEEVEAALNVARNARTQLVVSIGGGSATGLAKAVALRTSLPICAVPTTFSGSEATPMWGISTKHHKRTGLDKVVLPSTVIYDTELFDTLPSGLAVTSAFNALAHGVDALWAPHASPMSDADAEAGIRRISTALRLLTAGYTRETTFELLLGTYLSSVAFAASGPGMHHKLCHVLGGAYDLAHAPLHTVLLPHVLAYNIGAAPRAGHALERALGGDPVERLAELIETLGAPTSLEEIGFQWADIPHAAELCLGSIPESNPRTVDLSAVQNLLSRAHAGWPAQR